MKVGDLVRWDRDGDMGIILNFVRWDEGNNTRCGNPILIGKVQSAWLLICILAI
jgi:hypothetical protein